MNTEPLTAFAVLIAGGTLLFLAIAPFSISLAALSSGGLASLILLLAAVFFVFDIFVTTFGVATFIACLLAAWGLSDLATQGLIELPVSGPLLWLVLSLPGLVAMAVGLILWKRSTNVPITTGVESLIGETLTIKSWKDGAGKALLHGETWTIEPQDAGSIFKTHDTAIVVARNGLTLLIRHA